MLMLFHPPDFNFHSIDRFAFGLLILVVLLRVCVLRQPLRLGPGYMADAGDASAGVLWGGFATQ